MSENWRIQISPKLTDGTLVNLRAETPDEAERILEWAINNAAKIGDAVKAVNAVSIVGAALGGQVVPQQAPPQQGAWSQQGSQQAPAFAQPQQQAAPAADGLIPPQQCVHGAMQLRHAKPGAARQWSAYMCPTPQGTPGQCSPIDAKTGKSWKS